MAIQDMRLLGGLAASFFLGLLLQFLGCALWHNWWPMLTAFVYVLVPMPWLFFGGAGSGGSNLASSWQDAGKFLVGFSAVAAVAIPTILYHAQKITAGALWMELAAMAILGGTVLAWQFYSENEGSSPFYY
ncbi:hypothetical protein CHLNCDRAFT_134836 [Chlorella variabilis]|uniref:Uncharacterized protein n=1 Tax=Chlorella variabilis TaxID=554065 RepID=E1ZGW9_CHLVA|nr:hypothetical protein CHLNCDRAFT_134836 [Chlorella variabilis]EFN55013.1 hypothetical protein CHLNCDRAFT_134836 [Chlorella variabilis]|eukprot:XP_005847115.1 hypothetical protein CHLNCDRAFT_134836 [Chlorella variabilis]